jgi:predicted RecA/RadA family phage recombinase
MADYLPKFKPGESVTYTASAAVTGGRLVAVTASGPGVRSVAPAGVDSAAVVGVAGFDAAAGEPVTVYGGGVQRLVAAGVIAAGAPVTNRVGLALQPAAAANDVIDVLFN